MYTPCCQHARRTRCLRALLAWHVHGVYIPTVGQPSHIFRIRGEATSTLEIDVYDDIGESWWSDGVTARDVRATLRANRDAETISLRVNSRGGDVFDGIAIYNLLLDHPARVVADVDALAASMASVILMAADEIRIARGAMIMVHNPWGGAMGEAGDLRSAADVLDQIRGQMAAIYARRTGLPDETVLALMDAETWLDADASVERGFADTVKEPPAREAREKALGRLTFDGLDHAPRGLVAAAAAARGPIPAPRGAEIGEIQMSEEEIASLRSLLGLADDADGAAILEAVTALVDAATGPEEQGPGEEMAARLRVAERGLADAQAQLATYAERDAAAARAALEAEVDAAIAEGRAHEDCRDDLIRVATTDREAFDRLTARRTPRAPKGQVVKGERRTTPAALTDSEEVLFRNLTAAGWSRAKAMSKIRPEAVEEN